LSKKYKIVHYLGNFSFSVTGSYVHVYSFLSNGFILINKNKYEFYIFVNYIYHEFIYKLK